MSRAFVKESDEAGALPLPDRTISSARNLVTGRGLRLIERAIAQHRSELAAATAAADREALGRASRELRYWSARLASAELAEPGDEPDHVVFGATVILRRADDSLVTFRIVGEDEADPAAGRIAWTTPVARALLGSQPGDLCMLPTGEVEILALDPTVEPLE
jgi:transcription elongation GreA/GreB family factor